MEQLENKDQRQGIQGKPWRHHTRRCQEIQHRRHTDPLPRPQASPYGSCYLCVVEVEGLEKLVPSCSSPVAPGMSIHTDNEKIRESRKTALELLLSNHYADCLGPCTQTCPAGVDVQGYIALISAGRAHEAIKLIKETNPLPLVCGRVCVGRVRPRAGGTWWTSGWASTT